MLGSGSGGNAFIVKSDSIMILIDAGLSAAQIHKRMSMRGLSADDITACFITHEHGDHVRGASMLSLRHKVPIYMHPATKQKTSKLWRGNETIHFLEIGDSYEFSDITITSIPTSHDSESSMGFLFKNSRYQLGYLTDLGSVSEDTFLAMKDVDFIVMEANHDKEMLLNGPYPMHLKRRVDSRVGHLSNSDSGEFLNLLVELGKLKGAILAHLSEKNNTPEKALETVLSKLKTKIPVMVASQHEPSEIIEMEKL
jgi:phosphoribosyl 1,2-cyclic phosphodiesterase